MRPAPMIGVTLDREDGGAGTYSRFPWYALRQNYADCVAEAGGMPLAVPYRLDMVEEYAERLDGLLVTGGNFDVPPAMFGDGEVSAAVTTLKEERTAFELALTRAFLDRDKPVLGICGGQQLLAVVFGGTLVQHIPDAFPDALAHEQPNPRNEPGHSVVAVDGTRLCTITGPDPFEVNSAHHQAVRDPGVSMVVNAWAPDGVVEGLEHPGHRFCIGVQWHPEFHIGEADIRLLAAFVEACRP